MAENYREVTGTICNRTYISLSVSLNISICNYRRNYLATSSSTCKYANNTFGQLFILLALLSGVSKGEQVSKFGELSGVSKGEQLPKFGGQLSKFGGEVSPPYMAGSGLPDAGPPDVESQSINPIQNPFQKFATGFNESEVQSRSVRQVYEDNNVQVLDSSRGTKFSDQNSKFAGQNPKFSDQNSKFSAQNMKFVGGQNSKFSSTQNSKFPAQSSENKMDGSCGQSSACTNTEGAANARYDSRGTSHKVLSSSKGKNFIS